MYSKSDRLTVMVILGLGDVEDDVLRSFGVLCGLRLRFAAVLVYV